MEWTFHLHINLDATGVLAGNSLIGGLLTVFLMSKNSSNSFFS